MVLAALAAFLAMPAMADVSATEGWARATVPGTKVAAAYFVLTNNGDKERALLRIASPLCESSDRPSDCQDNRQGRRADATTPGITSSFS